MCKNLIFMCTHKCEVVRNAESVCDLCPLHGRGRAQITSYPLVEPSRIACCVLCPEGWEPSGTNVSVKKLLPSQQFGDVLVAQGIEGLRFPSQAGPGVNLVVYKKCCHPNALKIENEAALRVTIAAIARSIK